MAKGGNFENEIARQLSLWFTKGKRDDVFGRSDGSGARFTSRRKRGKDTANQHGDITFTDILGESLISIWSIEAKTGYCGKKKVKDADGDIVRIPVYAKQKKEDKGKEKKIIGWKDKTALVPWDAFDFIDSNQKTPVLQKMWEQCIKDAELSGTQPILIFRRNARQPCICIKRSYYNHLKEYFGRIGNLIVVDAGILDEEIIIMSLAEFFEWARPVCEFLSGK